MRTRNRILYSYERRKEWFEQRWASNFMLACGVLATVALVGVVL